LEKFHAALLIGWTRKAVWETIRICKGQNVLKEYLESREKEVIDIMMTLFDRETALNAWEYEIRQEERQRADRKVTEANQKITEANRKITEAKEETKAVSKRSFYALYERGTPVEEISILLGIPRETLEKWLKERIN